MKFIPIEKSLIPSSIVLERNTVETRQSIPDRVNTVVILQPGYLPWLGFFDMMWKSDLFVIYDDVQFDKHGWRNRNRIKTSNGWQWLTVPVLIKGKGKPTNRELLVNNSVDWSAKHLAAIKQNYGKAPFFRTYIKLFEDIYAKKWEFLIDLDMALIYMLMETLGLNTPLTFASDLNIEGGRIDRLVAICKHFGAKVFLEGSAGRAYLEDQPFTANGIRLAYHDYQHPTYNQLYGDFIPYLSVIDLLFNHGNESRGVLINAQSPLKEVGNK